MARGVDRERHRRRLEHPLDEPEAEPAMIEAMVKVQRGIVLPAALVEACDAMRPLLREALVMATSLGTAPDIDELRSIVGIHPSGSARETVLKKADLTDPAKALDMMHAGLRWYAAAWASVHLPRRMYPEHPYRDDLRLAQRLADLAGELRDRCAHVVRLGAEVRARAEGADWEMDRPQRLMPKERTAKGLKRGPFMRVGSAVAAEAIAALTASGQDFPPWSNSELAALFRVIEIDWLATEDRVRFFRNQKNRQRATNAPGKSAEGWDRGGA